MGIKVLVAAACGFLAFIALPAILQSSKPVAPAAPYIPPPSPYHATFTAEDREFDLFDVRMRLNSESNSYGPGFFGTIHNGGDAFTVHRIRLKIKTKDWTRDFYSKVEVQPLSTATFYVTIDEYKTKAENFWLIDVAASRP